MSTIIQDIERRQLREVPRFKAGDTVRVHFRVIEGTRSRIQVFEGIVIKRQGAGARETFTVRKNSFGVGVERTFPLHSPKIDKIEVGAIGDVHRAKLYYLRGKVGKKARVRELRQTHSSQNRALFPHFRHNRRPSLGLGSTSCLRRRSARARSCSASTGNLGGRFVAGADEAGRGPLAGPLVVAGVLLDYECLRDHRVRPLALLNDSKQVDADTRDELYRAVVACAERISVRVFPAAVIDRDGLHKCNLARVARGAVGVPARRRLARRRLQARADRAAAPRGRRRRLQERRDRRRVDRREGDARPLHAHRRRAVSRLRVRIPRRVHHAGAHRDRARARAVRDPPPLVAGACVPQRRRARRGIPSERRAAWWYRLRGYRVLAANCWAGGYELDLVVRRGRDARLRRGEVEGGRAASATRSRW